MAKKTEHQTFEYRESEIEQAIDYVEKLDISEKVRSLLIACLKTCLSVNALLQNNKALRRLLGRFFGFKSEKSGKNGGGNSSQSQEEKEEEKKKKKGHGRRGYQELENATHVHHPHPELKKGTPCPEEDCDGKVYPLKNPGVYVRVTANPPIQTTVHLTEKFRCNLCEKIFEFLPEEIKNREKYDEKVLTQVIMNKCFCGTAFGRDAALGGMSASVRSELFREADDLLRGVFDILVEQLICDGVIAFDDTKIKIQPEKKGGKKSAWASCFITREVVIYIFDRFHAGIGLSTLLEKRPEELGRMVLLSDALPSYQKYKEGHIDAHCLTHGRRRFVEAEEEDSEYCQLILGLIRKVYEVDSRGKELEDLERLKLHNLESRPIMEQLERETKKALDGESFFPNSQLGKAVKYIAENHSKLGVFLEVPGVPLDTNHVERKIKSPIRIRKQAPIFKTEMGAARTGRMLSITETCLLNDIRPWDYLCWAIKRAREGTPALENTPFVFKQLPEKGQGPKTRYFGREGPLAVMPESDLQTATN